MNIKQHTTLTSLRNHTQVRIWDASESLQVLIVKRNATCSLLKGHCGNPFGCAASNAFEKHFRNREYVFPDGSTGQFLFSDVTEFRAIAVFTVTLANGDVVLWGIRWSTHPAISISIKKWDETQGKYWEAENGIYEFQPMPYSRTIKGVRERSAKQRAERKAKTGKAYRNDDPATKKARAIARANGTAKPKRAKSFRAQVAEAKYGVKLKY